MERLTAWDGKHAYVKQCFENDCKGTTGADVSKCINCRHYAKVFDRLAAYEDTGLSPEEVAGLAQAKREERLVELPCKVGDAVYSWLWSIANERSIVKKGTIVNVRYDAVDGIVTVSDGERYFTWGNRAFATREEAEAALAKEDI